MTIKERFGIGFTALVSAIGFSMAFHSFWLGIGVYFAIVSIAKIARFS